MCEYCYRPCCCQRWRRLPVPAEPHLARAAPRRVVSSPGEFRGEGERIVPWWIEVEELGSTLEPAEA